MKLIVAIFSIIIINSTLVLAKSPTLVSPQWLKENLAKVVLIDLSDQAQYQQFHLPNAIYVNYQWLIKPQDGLALSGGTKHMQKILSQLGINQQDHLVIYDNMGNLNSSRLYWELMKLNHPKVSMLDGGLISWVLASYPVTQAKTNYKKTNYKINKADFTDKYTANKEEVFASINDKNTILLDTRSKAEYFGNPKNKTRQTGHIPTAIFFPWEVAVDIKNGFRQKNDQKITIFLNSLKITDKNKQIIAYCNSGHRASRVFTLLKSKGFKNIKLYDASMQEWELSANNPLKIGMKP